MTAVEQSTANASTMFLLGQVQIFNTLPRCKNVLLQDTFPPSIVIICGGLRGFGAAYVDLARVGCPNAVPRRDVDLAREGRRNLIPPPRFAIRAT